LPHRTSQVKMSDAMLQFHMSVDTIPPPNNFKNSHGYKILQHTGSLSNDLCDGEDISISHPKDVAMNPLIPQIIEPKNKSSPSPRTPTIVSRKKVMSPPMISSPNSYGSLSSLKDHITLVSESVEFGGEYYSSSVSEETSLDTCERSERSALGSSGGSDASTDSEYSSIRKRMISINVDNKSRLTRPEKIKEKKHRLLEKHEAVNDVYGSYWNYKFQKWLSAPRSGLQQMKLRNVVDDFVEAAESYAKIIISEFDPAIIKLFKASTEGDVEAKAKYEKKIANMTIKPDNSIGGVAGGIKFLHNGIMFKFALDWHGIYDGNNEWAMKSALNELKGARSVFKADIPDLSFPLMAVIRYCGYMMVASSIVPIDSSTMWLGLKRRSGKGSGYYSVDDNYRLKVLDLGDKLNLLPSKVKSIENKVIEIAGPLDMGTLSLPFLSLISINMLSHFITLLVF